jgi:hypothetical protein
MLNDKAYSGRNIPLATESGPYAAVAQSMPPDASRADVQAVMESMAGRRLRAVKGFVSSA